MGSFPSQEQTVHPTGASDVDANTATPHHLQSRTRTHQTLIKKRTRGKILFLGLDGAGKTTLIHHLLRYVDEVDSPSTIGEMMRTADDQKGFRVYPNPTKSLQSSTYRLESDRYLHIIDLPGRRDFRPKWYTASLASAHESTYYNSSTSGSGGGIHALPLLGVVFVVDASDCVRFPIVAEELVRYQKLKEQKKAFQKAQFVLLLNKSDRAVPGSATPRSEEKQATQAYRAAMRGVRRELKKCVDHQLRMDQKRNPSDYQYPAQTPASQSNINHSFPPSRPEVPPPGAPPCIKSPKTPLIGANRSASSADGSVNRTTAMMTSILECNAHDRESIKGVHSWLKEEIKKAL